MSNHFLKFSDIASHEIQSILDRATELKSGLPSNALADKSIAILFEKPSLRTKLSFWVGTQKLAGNPVYFGPEEVGLGKREPVADVAHVMSRISDIIVIRTFLQSTIEEFAANASVPVINALTEHEHPCQALADILPITEQLGRVAGANGYGEHLGGCVTQVTNPREAVIDADIVYTDVWTSMGQESENAERLAAFKGYQVNPAMLDQASSNVKFMHDLPAHPGEEISGGLLYDPRSIAFDQAENRLWAQAALMEKVI